MITKQESDFGTFPKSFERANLGIISYYFLKLDFENKVKHTPQLVFSMINLY